MYTRSELGHNAENRHQRFYEQKALDVISSIYKEFPIEKCGIGIDSELFFVGASPVARYGDNCLIFIKCPLKLFNKSVDEAIIKLPFWKKDRGQAVINEMSDWHIQIQGQLRIFRFVEALVMIWLGKEYKILKILRNDDFFETRMKSKLTEFYDEVMIKELVDPRKTRSMGLREYNEELKAFV